MLAYRLVPPSPRPSTCLLRSAYSNALARPKSIVGGGEGGEEGEIVAPAITGCFARSIDSPDLYPLVLRIVRIVRMEPSLPETVMLYDKHQAVQPLLDTLLADGAILPELPTPCDGQFAVFRVIDPKGFGQSYTRLETICLRTLRRHRNLARKDSIARYLKRVTEEAHYTDLLDHYHSSRIPFAAQMIWPFSWGICGINYGMGEARVSLS